MELDRRSLLRAGAASLVAGACTTRSVADSDEEPPRYQPPYVLPLIDSTATGTGLTRLPHPELAELSIADLAGQLARGELTSVALVGRYRERIAALDPALRSILEVNREAEQIAARCDREPAAP